MAIIPLNNYLTKNSTPTTNFGGVKSVSSMATIRSQVGIPRPTVQPKISQFASKAGVPGKPLTSGKTITKSVDNFFQKTLPDTATRVAGGFLEGGMAVGKSLVDYNKQKFGADVSLSKPSTETFVPKSKAGRALAETLFGKPEVDIANIPRYGQQFTELVGVKSENPLINVPIGGAMALLDFTTGGGAKNVFKALSKTTKVDEVVKTLKAINVAEDLATEYAPLIAKTSNETDIQKWLTHIENIQKTTKPKPGFSTLTPSNVPGTTKYQDLAPTGQAKARSMGYNPTAEELAPKTLKATPQEAVTSKTLKATNTELPSTGQKVQRGFIGSAKEVVPKADKLAGQYIPRSTDELAIKAKNYIADDIVGAEKRAMTEASDEAVAIGAELIKKYGDEAAKATDAGQAGALYDKAAEIANTLAPKLTEQGRAIQAASILGRLTPEGQLRFAAREIQRYNELNPLKKIPELTGEQTQKILKDMKEIKALPDGIEKAMRFQKLQDYVKSLTPTPLIKKIVTVWKAGLLTGLKTTGLNIFSNLSHAATEIVKDAPAAVVDSVASLFTGQRTKTFTAKGVAKGTKEGFEKGLTYLKTGFDERNLAQKLDYHKVNFGKGKIGRIGQVYTEAVFRVMGATDQPFYYGALSRSLMDQSLAQGMNKGLKGAELKEFAENLIQNPTEEMLRYGVADAATAVFQNETYLGQAAKALQRIPVVGEILVPFGRTPSAVATQIINYSPVGIAKTIYENASKGKFDQRLFSQGIGRGLTGTAVLAIGAMLGREGLISLDRPTTEREQKLWELEGRKPNSIKIGNKWRSPIVLGPAGNLLLIGGHFNRAFKESGSPTEAMSEAVLGTGKSFTEQTFLTGINQAIGALNDPERFATNYIGQLASSVVPTLISDVARATDPLERRIDKSGLSGIIQRIQARFPGARKKLEPQIDVLGREKEIAGNPLEVLFDPTRPQPDISTPTIKELRRLTESGFAVSPTLLGDKKGYPVLSPEQNTDLWKRAGEVTNEKLTSLFNSEKYKSLSDDEKAEIVEKFIEQAQVNTRAEKAIELTEGLSGEELKAKLSELKTGKLLNRNVFSKYMELR